VIATRPQTSYRIPMTRNIPINRHNPSESQNQDLMMVASNESSPMAPTW